MVDTLDRAKRFAKRLQKEARTSEPLRLSAAQEIAAKVLGYKDWHHLTVRLQEGRPLAEPAVGGRHLESALRDLGSAVDGRELYGRLAGVAGPDSGVDPDFVPTPSSRAVVELVDRCPAGRFVLVTGQPDSGKSAAVGQLVRERGGLGPSPAGKPVRVSCSLISSANALLGAIFYKLEGHSLQGRSAAVLEARVVEAIRNNRIPLVFLDSFESLGRSGVRKPLEAMESLARVIAASGARWAIAGHDWRDPGQKRTTSELVDAVSALGDLCAGRFSMPALTSTGGDLEALAIGFEKRATGGDGAFFADQANRRALLEGAFDRTMYSVMAFLDDMKDLLAKRKGCSWSQAFVLAQANVVERKQQWAAASPESVAALAASVEEKPRKFDMISLLDLFDVKDVLSAGASEGSRFHFDLNGIRFRLRLRETASGSGRGLIEVSALDYFGSPTAALRSDHGVLIASPAGSPAALSVKFDFAATGTDRNFVYADAEVVWPFLERYIKPMLTPSPLTLTGGSVAELRAAVDLILDATAADVVVVESETPCTAFHFGIQRGVARRFPGDVVETLRELLWSEFGPRGWGYSRSRPEEIEPVAIWRQRGKPKPRAGADEIAARAERRLRARSALLRSYIAELANLPLV
ncbi:MAG: hypothetical protein IPM67_15045 [Sphingomonadales bacterium]|nr:hypothetical protein [Sphingomonadales bacterium]